MDDTAKFLAIILVLLVIGIIAFVAMNGGGAAGATGTLSGAGPSYLPGSIGGGCGI